jgi:L-lactate dehydrogenase complex protein LldF
VVCPVKIPLPELLRKLREKQFDLSLRPWTERFALRGWTYLASRPQLYAFATAIGARVLRRMGDGRGMIRRLPFGAGWTDGRDLPAPVGETFRALVGEQDAHN